MSQERSLREHIYHFIDNEEEQTFGSHSFEIFITGLILISIVTIVLESFAHLRADYGMYFNLFETSTLIIFAIEYILRVATADYKFKDASSWSNAARRFIFSGSGIVDLLAISPIFFQFTAVLGWASADLRFVRVLKITRLLRVFKMNSFTNSVTVIVDVCYEKKHDLGITMFVTFILLFVSATLMWYLEGNEQPEQFPNILATLWWAIATLTTVGYGDVYPITAWGKVMAGIIALLGIGLVALPAGILSSAFIEKLEDGTIKEEEVENYVPKGHMPQAQFQKIVSKNHDHDPKAKINVDIGSGAGKTTDDDVGKEEKPIFKPLDLASKFSEPNNHSECGQYFGQSFIYCPYCGTKLEGNETHKHV